MSEGFALPEGARLGPNCGVTAVAIAAGVSFDHAWEVIKRVGGRQGNWKGRTFRKERLQALFILGVNIEPVPMRRMTLARFINDVAKFDHRYIVSVTGHTMITKGTAVLDQWGTRSLSSQPALGRKRVFEAYRIVE
jgi:hypothetical protein